MIQFNAAELVALHAGNSIEFGKALVQECVLAVDKIENALVRFHHVREEGARFGIHGMAELAVEFRELHGIGMDAVKIAQLQPLAGKVINQRGGFGIKQHAAHLRVQHCRLIEAIFSGLLQQLRIGHAAP